MFTNRIGANDVIIFIQARVYTNEKCAALVLGISCETERCILNHHLYVSLTFFFFPQVIVDGMREIGHIPQKYSTGGSVICSITRENGTVYANSDFRKAGEVDGF